MISVLIATYVWMVIGLIVVAPITFLLRYIIALRAPPDARAAWTAGTGFILAAILLIVVGSAGGHPFSAPLIAIPGALICYWALRADFRRAWINEGDPLPYRTHAAEDDWRYGLAKLVVIVVLGALVAWIRQSYHLFY
jgi:hypothetical protein